MPDVTGRRRSLVSVRAAISRDVRKAASRGRVIVPSLRTRSVQAVHVLVTIRLAASRGCILPRRAIFRVLIRWRVQRLTMVVAVVMVVQVRAVVVVDSAVVPVKVHRAPGPDSGGSIVPVRAAAMVVRPVATVSVAVPAIREHPRIMDRPVVAVVVAAVQLAHLVVRAANRRRLVRIGLQSAMNSRR